MDYLDKAKDLYNQALKAVSKTETEKKLAEALSNENWGASTTLMREIANLTNDYQEYAVVMKEIWQTVGAQPRQWRQIFKALTLVEYLVKNGNDRCVQEAKDRIHLVRTLTGFSYCVEGGEKGAGVREKAKQLLELLGDADMIKDERERARALRDKYTGIGRDGAPFQASSGAGGSSVKGYDNDGGMGKSSGIGRYNDDDFSFGKYKGNGDKDDSQESGKKKKDKKDKKKKKDQDDDPFGDNDEDDFADFDEPSTKSKGKAEAVPSFEANFSDDEDRPKKDKKKKNKDKKKDKEEDLFGGGDDAKFDLFSDGPPAAAPSASNDDDWTGFSAAPSAATSKPRAPSGDLGFGDFSSPSASSSSSSFANNDPFSAFSAPTASSVKPQSKGVTMPQMRAPQQPMMMGGMGNQQQPMMMGGMGNQQQPMMMGGMGNQQQPMMMGGMGNQQQPMMMGGMGNQQPMMMGMGNQQQPMMMGSQQPMMMGSQQPMMMGSQQPMMMGGQQPMMSGQRSGMQQQTSTVADPWSGLVDLGNLSLNSSSKPDSGARKSGLSGGPTLAQRRLSSGSQGSAGFSGMVSPTQPPQQPGMMMQPQPGMRQQPNMMQQQTRQPSLDNNDFLF